MLYKGLGTIWDHLSSSLAFDNIAFPMITSGSGLSGSSSDVRTLSSGRSIAQVPGTKIAGQF